MFRVEDFMRGSVIEYQEDRPYAQKYGKWFRDIVWGFTSDENCRDVVELGVNGALGYVDVTSIRGIDITEDILLDYGFLHVKNIDNISTYYRDDIGYVMLTTYGLKHVYRGGAPMRYFHEFQRVFYDYLKKPLHPKTSEQPKQEPKFSVQVTKKKTAEELLKEVDDVNSRMQITGTLPEFKF